MKKNWTTANIPNLSGQIYVVTGANSGLGFDTSKELAHKGAKVIMTARNLDKGQQAIDQIKAELPTADIELMQLDLANLQQVQQFVDNYKNQYQQLNVLINNAGVMMPATREETKEGFEL